MMDSPAARLFEQMNKTAATTLANATNTSTRSAAGNVGTDVSYNNMYYMNMVNVALLGEIVGNARAAEMGYRLIDNWLQYEQTADLHEFTSPTYYWVQVNSLYMGYLYAKRAGAKAVFKVRRNGASALLLAAALLRVTALQCTQAILDHTWADIAANYFIPSQTLSGPSSRDYDFLYGHGALMVTIYAQGLPGATNGSLMW